MSFNINNSFDPNSSIFNSNEKKNDNINEKSIHDEDNDLILNQINISFNNFNNCIT